MCLAAGLFVAGCDARPTVEIVGAPDETSVTPRETPSDPPAGAPLPDGWRDDVQAPRAIVESYITDFDAWNTFAMESKQADGDLTRAEAAYDEIIARYCRPGHERQGIAFGSSSDHSPQREKVLSVETDDGRSVVKTQSTAGRITCDYEYVLEHDAKAGRWYLVSVLYVDENGKYEGL